MRSENFRENVGSPRSKQKKRKQHTIALYSALQASRPEIVEFWMRVFIAIQLAYQAPPALGSGSFGFHPNVYKITHHTHGLEFLRNNCTVAGRLCS